jgi:hypothetical protein
MNSHLPAAGRLNPSLNKRGTFKIAGFSPSLFKRRGNGMSSKLFE